MRRYTICLGITALMAGGWHAASAGPPLELKVVKNKVVNSLGEPVRLRGVNAASLEWSSDGEKHILKTIDIAIHDWHVNHVRLPLAQDRWFGKAKEQHDEGKAYRALVRDAVDLCSAHDCYVILDLHWSDAGEWGKDIGQHKMPDKNSVAFWREVAAVYANNPAVLFDLYNEPFHVSWDIWMRGGEVTEKNKTGESTTYQAVGMQALLDTVRATGAKNVVIAGGIDWSYDLSEIAKGARLVDFDGHGVIYANHAYPFKGDTVEKWIAKMEKYTKELPVIVSEFGSDAKGGAGLSGEEWVRKVVDALEKHEWAWTAWDLHPAAGPTLVSDWKYTPTPYFGVMVKKTLAEKRP